MSTQSVVCQARDRLVAAKAWVEHTEHLRIGLAAGAKAINKRIDDALALLATLEVPRR